MAKVTEFIPGVITFICPGCEKTHTIWARPSEQPVSRNSWEFNGDFDHPTINPSILMRLDYTDPSRQNLVCHSFVTDGKIQFLNDCTHPFAGQTLDLPEVEV